MRIAVLQLLQHAPAGLCRIYLCRMSAPLRCPRADKRVCPCDQTLSVQHCVQFGNSLCRVYIIVRRLQGEPFVRRVRPSARCCGHCNWLASNMGGDWSAGGQRRRGRPGMTPLSRVTPAHRPAPTAPRADWRAERPLGGPSHRCIHVCNSRGGGSQVYLCNSTSGRQGHTAAVPESPRLYEPHCFQHVPAALLHIPRPRTDRRADQATRAATMQGYGCANRCLSCLLSPVNWGMSRLAAPACVCGRHVRWLAALTMPCARYTRLV